MYMRQAFSALSRRCKRTCLFRRCWWRRGNREIREGRVFRLELCNLASSKSSSDGGKKGSLRREMKRRRARAAAGLDHGFGALDVHLKQKPGYLPEHHNVQITKEMKKNPRWDGRHSTGRRGDHRRSLASKAPTPLPHPLLPPGHWVLFLRCLGPIPPSFSSRSCLRVQSSCHLQRAARRRQYMRVSKAEFPRLGKSETSDRRP